MIFALPIGIYILLQEKKGKSKYQAVFDGFFKKIEDENSLSKKEKIEILSDMLYKNGYEITQMSKELVRGEKKIFSVGWLFIGVGTLYIGLIVYIIYFLYFQKPHVVLFEL
jgi:uncharacterized membrane protein YukC